MLTILAPAFVLASPSVIRFRLLAVERQFDSLNMMEGQDLISTLLNYQNWNNSTASFVSYIHLLTMFSIGDLPATIQPFYCGGPTKANLEYEIKNFLGQAGDEEIVILYYCGHGGDKYLSLDFGVSDAELTSWLSWGGLPDAYVTVILDTCHSGSWINDGSSPGVLGNNRDVLAACKSTQLANCWGCHTAFTDEGLLPGFALAFDTFADGWVSVAEVFTYAAPACIAYASSNGVTQEPVNYYDICTGNIPLVQRDTTQPFPDFAYPTTTFNIGTPKWAAWPNTYVTSATSLNFTAEDLFCPTSGVDFTKYKIDAGSWVTYIGPFILPGTMDDGPHTIYYYSQDNAGNVEPQKSTTVILDNTPPSTTLSIGTPQYSVGPDKYITSATELSLAATDLGSGVYHTYYKIGAGPWIESTSFTITGPDGTYGFQWYSKDHLGNTETTHSGTVILDNTPPTTILIIGIPNYTDLSSNLYVASWTPFTLSPTDGGSGVAQTNYGIHNATYNTGWLPYDYVSPFTLAGLAEDTYIIEYRSTDNLGNVEPTNSKSVILDSKMAMAGWAKTEIQQLKNEVAASGVHPSFVRLGCFYLDVALRELDGGVGDGALADIGRGWETQANCHLSCASIYVRKFYTLINSWRSLLGSPVLAAKWQQQAMQIVQDIATAINTPI